MSKHKMNSGISRGDFLRLGAAVAGGAMLSSLGCGRSKKQPGDDAEKRENSLLSLGSQGNNPLVVTTFGDNHRWGGLLSCGHGYFYGHALSGLNTGDNIFRWNLSHPDIRYSLIEITPSSLTE